MANNKSKQNNRNSARSKAAAAQERADRNAAINRVAGVVLFALSVIFFYIAVISGEGAWHIIHNFYVGLFGILASCIFPVLTVIVTILYSIKDKEPKKLISKGILSVVMILLISAFIHIVQNQTGADFC